jgi:O-antigen biosynthesis protein
MRVVVLILSWNGSAVLRDCLHALAPQLSAERTLMVVDNGSEDDSVACARRLCPGATIIENKANLGFSGGVNVGLRALLQHEPPPVVVLLNQDTVVAPDWLERLLEPFVDPQVGAAGCKLLYPDRKIQHAGVVLEYPRQLARHRGWREPDLGQYDEPRDMEYVTGAALAIRCAALAQVGLLDEGYTPAYYEDMDLCWRLRRAGYRIVYTGAAGALHQESSSTSDPVRRSMLYNRNRLRFVLKTAPADAFWQDFVPAERRFIAEHGTGPEARALRWAYLHSLLMLPDSLQARAGLAPSGALDRNAVGRLLLDLRRWISICEHRRIAARTTSVKEYTG